jgi:hypothetical protein
LSVKDESKKDESIFWPLAGAHRFDEGFEHELMITEAEEIGNS